MELPKYYSVAELTQLFGVSRTTLYNWMDWGWLDYDQVGGRRRFTREQVEQFIKSGKNRQQEKLTPSLASA